MNRRRGVRFWLTSVAFAGCVTSVVFEPPMQLTATAAPQAPAAGQAEQQARTVCGSCHAFAPPEILPRGMWRDEFVRMMFIREKRLPPIGPSEMVRNIPLPDDMQQVLPYYTTGAPERLPVPESWPPPDSAVRFTRRGMSPADFPSTPAISHVNLVDVDCDGRLDVLATDMRQGLVLIGNPAAAGKAALRPLASIPHPAHVTVTDLDADGVADLLVGDMGEFFPADHGKGAVILLRGLAQGKFGAFWLDGWPRVADVQAADFNGDAKLDLVVAAFGWRKTGQIAILENRSTDYDQPQFVNHTIDPRTGGINVVPVDLNKDGQMDFITVLAQEHETILAYINRGTRDFAFEQKVIYTAPHPNWGSSGIQVVDLDRDGDLDVLYTHGDTFDDGVVKPYHGIQWLENTGAFPFVEHSLAQMPGVHRALAADLDGDGDNDVVACALLAGGSDLDERSLPALVWLEQTSAGKFVRHTLEMGVPRHASLDVGDIDGDGDQDIVVGAFSVDKPAAHWLEVWENQSKGAQSAAAAR